MLKKEGKGEKEKVDLTKATEEIPVGPPRFSHEHTPPINPVGPESIPNVQASKKLGPILSPKPPQKSESVSSTKALQPSFTKLPKYAYDNPPFSTLFTPITLPSKIDSKEKKELVSKITFVKKSKDLKVVEEKASQERQLKLPAEKEKTSQVLKQVPPPIKEPPRVEGYFSKNKKVILIVILVILAVVLLLAYLFLNSGKSSRRDLIVAGDVKEAYVLDDAAYVTFYPYDSEAVKIIILGFLDNKGNSYPYTIQEPSAEYKFYAQDLGLKSLDSLVAVSGVIEYKPVTPKNITPLLLPLPPTNQTINVTKNKPSGGGSGGGTSPPSASCTNDAGCFSIGISCSGSLPYNCSLGADGCLNRVNLNACAAGWQCVNGTGCVETSDCTASTAASDCATFFDSCSYGICNSTGKCEIRYNSSVVCRAASGECDLADSCSGSSSDCFDSKKIDSTACSSGKCLSGSCVKCIADTDCSSDGCSSGAYRDYFCNLSNGCAYNITTKTENLTNDNCAEGIDNDCDGNKDWADSGCGTSPLCGNNIREGTEVCDGTDLGGKSCTDWGYSLGVLGCLTDCSNYNTGGCASGAIQLSSCRVLNETGKTYNLINDLTAPSLADCFVIKASDITLDCQSYKITGASAQSAVKIAAVRATVKNCVIDNVGASTNYGAIYILSNNATVMNNEIKNSYKAIKSSGVSYLRIYNNLIKNNDYGIETSSLILDSTIEQNVIEGSDYSGLSINSNRGVIKNNNISYNQYGIYLIGGTFSNNIIVKNNISRNDMDGIYLSSSGGNNSFIDNMILGNRGGIDLGFTSNSNLTGNIICSRDSFYDDISCVNSQRSYAKNTCSNIGIMCDVTCDYTCGAPSLSLWTRVKQVINRIL